jgi:hypothetical protein
MTADATGAFEALTRSQLIALLEQYARLMLTIDGLWFLGVEKSAGLDAAVKMDEEVWRQLGAIEARRMMRFIGLERVEDLDSLRRLVGLSPMWASFEHDVQLEGERCVLTVSACHPQIMRVKKGLGEFPCKSVGLAYFEGFAPVLSPDLRFACRVCPPDDHPGDLWCSWELWFERGADGQMQ